MSSVGHQLHRVLVSASERAAASHGVVKRDLTVAGTTIRVTMTPDLDARYGPAFLPAGIAATPFEPSARFVAWDSAHSGEVPPRSPWQPEDFLPRDGIRGSGADGVDFAFNVEFQQLSVWDRASGTGVFWTADSDRLPYWDPTAPFLSLLQWALADRALVLAHAAAVGTERGGVLIVGRGGRGKSTTALACLADGWKVVGDDYCVLTTGAAPSGHGLYRWAKLDDRTAELLPSEYRAEAPGFESHPKRIIALDQVAPGRVVPSLELRAVVVPRIAAATGRPVPLAAIDGLRTLAPSTIYQMTGTRPDTLARFSAAVHGLPVYGLEVGPDLTHIPTALSEVLEGGGR